MAGRRHGRALPEHRLAARIATVLTMLWLVGAVRPAPAQIEEEDLVAPSAVDTAGAETTPTELAGDELTTLERSADAAYARDDLEAAIALYRQVAALQSTSAERLRLGMTIASLEHELGRDGDARRTLLGVLELDPEYTLQSELYAPTFVPLFYDAQKEALAQRSARAADLVRTGLGHLRAREWQSARQAFDDALELRPDQPRALYNRALVDFYLGDLDAALGGFQKLLALDAAQREDSDIDAGLRSLALTNVGLIYLSRGRLDEALDVLERAVDADADNQPAWLNLGLARRRDGSGSAIDALRRAHELAPDDPMTVNALALAHLDGDDHVAAAALLRGAADAAPERAELWLNLGRAQRGLGDDDTARESFERALGADADNAQGWADDAAVHLARLHLDQGRPEPALRFAERATGWRDDLVNAWIYQGLAHQQLGQLDKARTALETARRLEPTRAEIHANLGSLLFELDRLDEAEASLRRALDIDPSAASVRENLEAVQRTRARGGRAASAGDAARSTTPRSSRPSPPPSAPPPPPPPPDLGLRFSDVDYTALGLQGVMVDEVFEGSAAGRAGIRQGDLLLRAGGESLRSGDALRRLAAESGSGTTIVLDLLRENRPLTVSLRIP
ncbi:MAG: tetratricopeptide repeat protein [Acidobacteriota bacterium]